MNTINVPFLCNARCQSCRRKCAFTNSDYIRTSVGINSNHSHMCATCICKTLPFSKINNHALNFIFHDTLREVIKKFQNLNLEHTDTLDSIECCKYLELDDVRRLSSTNPETHSFSLVHVNIVSLDKNIDKIRTLLYGLDSNPDIIAVTETRINDENVSYSDCDLRGYSKFQYDPSPPDGRPGGAGLFIKNGIDFEIRHDLKLSTEECENIWI